MFNPNYVANAPDGGVAMLEVIGEERAQMRFVPLRHVEVSGEVTGPVAGMQVVHVFGFTKAQCPQVLEAAYRFPLPGDAAVTGVSVQFGDVEIQAVLEPRAQAEEEYQEAKRDRKQAALVTREASDVFTLRIAGIKPGQDVRVETAFVQLARPEGAGWSLRLPLTVAERFMRSDEDPSAGDRDPLAQAVDPGYRASLDLTIVDASGIASPTHALSVTPDGREHRVTFEEGDILPDSDAVIVWQPVADATRPALSAFMANAAGRTPFLALVMPSVGEQQIVPRELTVLVDHSGSMEGPKWEAADWAVKRLIGMLTGRDRLRLGVFHNTTTWWNGTGRGMDEGARADAVHFLESHRDSGGTELGMALEQALQGRRAPNGFARHILIVTDAQVSDEGRLVRLAEEESKHADCRRISILCVDSSPNAALARKLAEAGGGYDWYVTSNPEGEDITTALDAIIDMWARPVATGLRLEVQTVSIHAASRRLLPSHDGWAALDVGDLPGGMPLWIAGATGGEGPLSLRLVDQAGAVLSSWSESSDEQSYPAVAALVDARVLQQLEAMRGAMYDEAQITAKLAELGVAPAEEGGNKALYPGNRKRDDTLEGIICRESLRSGLASSATAFVAIRSQAGKSVERSVVVANAVPQGWEMGQLMMVRAPSTVVFRSHAGNDFGRCFEDIEAAPDVRYFQDNVPASVPTMPQQQRGGTFPDHVTLFDGVPAGSGRVVLAERTIGLRGTKGLQASRLLSLAAEGDPGAFPAGAELLLFVGDMARARARVQLADLLHGAVRPLNVNCADGQVLRLVLVIPGPDVLGRLKVTLGIG
jgi:Ca-activated chloride channel family protein